MGFNDWIAVVNPGIFNSSEIFTKTGEQKWVYYPTSLNVYLTDVGIVHSGNIPEKLNGEDDREKMPDTTNALRYCPGSTRIL